MQVTRYSEAKPYEAPEHYDMRCLRLQGKEATATDTIWIGLSHLLPGGRTSLKDSPVEKIYTVVAGEVTVESTTEEIRSADAWHADIQQNTARTLAIAFSPEGGRAL